MNGKASIKFKKAYCRICFSSKHRVGSAFCVFSGKSLSYGSHPDHVTTYHSQFLEANVVQRTSKRLGRHSLPSRLDVPFWHEQLFCRCCAAVASSKHPEWVREPIAPSMRATRLLSTLKSLSNSNTLSQLHRQKFHATTESSFTVFNCACFLSTESSASYTQKEATLRSRMSTACAYSTPWPPHQQHGARIRWPRIGWEDQQACPWSGHYDTGKDGWDLLWCKNQSGLKFAGLWKYRPTCG